MEKATKCSMCNEQPFVDGVEVQMVSVTESGKITTPYDTKKSSSNVLLPMCAYHMVLSAEGILAITTQGQLISPSWLGDFEKLSDNELKIKSKLKRSDKLKHQSHLAKTLLDARKFQSEMKKNKNG